MNIYPMCNRYIFFTYIHTRFEEIEYQIKNNEGDHTRSRSRH